jgi:hypothetical protein
MKCIYIHTHGIYKNVNNFPVSKITLKLAGNILKDWKGVSRLWEMLSTRQLEDRILVHRLCESFKINILITVYKNSLHQWQALEFTLKLGLATWLSFMVWILCDSHCTLMLICWIPIMFPRQIQSIYCRQDSFKVQYSNMAWAKMT